MANILKQFLLICCFIVMKSESFPYEAPSHCYNPNGRSGLCVSIYECQSLLNSLKTYQTSAFIFARKSQCDPKGEGRPPFVCCTSDTGFTTRNQAIIFPQDYDDGEYDRTTARMPRLMNKTSRVNISLFPKPPDCGPIAIGNKIYGGDEAELGEFPWLANLEYKKPNRGLVSVCAGNIINQRYLLTAAHCVRGKIEEEAGQLVSLLVGVHNTKTSIDCDASGCLDPYQRLGVAKTIVHPEYGSRNGLHNLNDIALVKTDRNMEFSFSVAPICLPDAVPVKPELKNGMKLLVAGWGHTGTSKYSAEKRKVELPYVENHNCPFRVIPEQLCAGGEYRKDSCSGDSGSGLVRLANDAWIVEGIVSYGRGCGLERPGVYTRVSSYIPWIHNNVEMP